MGAFTSVGGDVAMTMASLLSQFQAFDDLELEAGDGEPATGASTPLPASLTGVRRLSALGLLSLQECAASAPSEAPAPLFVCAPSADDCDEPLAGLLEDHVMEEEHELFPRVRELMDREQLLGIAQEMLATMAELQQRGDRGASTMARTEHPAPA